MFICIFVFEFFSDLFLFYTGFFLLRFASTVSRFLTRFISSICCVLVVDFMFYCFSFFFGKLLKAIAIMMIVNNSYAVFSHL